MGPATFSNLGTTTDRTDYLRFVASLPFTKDYVAKSIELLELRAGQTLLDLGCGIAHDIGALCESLAPGGKLILVDHDAELLHIGERSSIGHTSKIETVFSSQDAQALKFSDRSVDATRIVRTLMHVEEPGRVVAEMARITKLGGKVLAIEPDWSTWSETVSPSISGVVRDAISSGIKHPRVGADLEGLFKTAGLVDLSTERVRMSFSDPAMAEKAFLIEDKVTRKIGDGSLSSDTRQQRTEEITRAHQSGSYDCGVGFVLCRGTVRG